MPMTRGRVSAVVIAMAIGISAWVFTAPDNTVEFEPCADRSGDACATVSGQTLRLVPPVGRRAVRVPERLAVVRGAVGARRSELGGVAQLVVPGIADVPALLVRLRSAEVRVGIGARSRAVLDRAAADRVGAVVLIDPPRGLSPTGPPLDTSLLIVGDDLPPNGGGLAGLTRMVRASSAQQRADCARDVVAAFVANPLVQTPTFIDCANPETALSP
ncbi:MAG: hypothetical protein R2878_14175 [Thermoleophilia bacterium]